MAKTKKADGKRDRLIEAAVTLAYRQGYRQTSLADIAAEADVPLGNVYYYFKTKDAIGEAVLARRDADFDQLRERFDALELPEVRLKAFIDMTMRGADMVAELGCPRGSLSSELLKSGDELAAQSNRLFARPMRWMEEQFSQMGHAKDAAALALQLQASLQGASLLAQSFRDADVLRREGERLKVWIDTLAA